MYCALDRHHNLLVLPFIDVFSPIIVIVTSRNMIFFILMKKKNFKCEPQYFLFLMSKFFTMNHSMKLGAL